MACDSRLEAFAMPGDWLPVRPFTLRFVVAATDALVATIVACLREGTDHETKIRSVPFFCEHGAARIRRNQDKAVLGVAWDRKGVVVQV